MRLIDADKLIESMGVFDAVKWGNKDRYQQDKSYSTLMCYEIKDYIDSQPTVDAVPVIRCNDCINWDTDWTTHPPDHYCPAIDQFTSADFYCGYAEKMEEQDAAD